MIAARLLGSMTAFGPLERGMYVIKALQQLIRSDAMLVRHDDEFDRNQEDTGLKQQIMRKTLGEERGYEEDQRDEDHKQ